MCAWVFPLQRPKIPQQSTVAALCPARIRAATGEYITMSQLLVRLGKIIILHRGNRSRYTKFV